MLEYSCTSVVKIFLNGTEIKNVESGGQHYNDYGLISSDDGALPLGLLKPGQINVLAFSQKHHSVSMGQTLMTISYRLTLVQNIGAPIFIDGGSANTKLLHLDATQDLPQGWAAPGFNDAAWVAPMEVRTAFSSCGLAPFLVDPSKPDAEANWLPYLTHSRTGNANSGEINCFRTSFSLATPAGQIRVYPYQPSPKKGEKAMIALIPDGSGGSSGDLQISMVLPAGLEAAQTQGAQYDAAHRRLIWRYSSPSKTLSLPLESVLDNKAVTAPHLCLGPWKADRTPDHRGTPSEEAYWTGADAPANSALWFKVGAPPFKDGNGAPVILGVTFQGQMLPGGTMGEDRGGDGVDDILFNYSVDGSMQGILKQDAKLTRFGGFCPLSLASSTDKRSWLNGHYEAGRDRRWTWADLANLRVHLQIAQHGIRHEDHLLSLVTSVRYYQPAEAMPRFSLQVSEAACKQLPLTVYMQNAQGSLAAQGLLKLPVNCAGAK
jgi:hypothetical protein